MGWSRGGSDQHHHKQQSVYTGIVAQRVAGIRHQAGGYPKVGAHLISLLEVVDGGTCNLAIEEGVEFLLHQEPYTGKHRQTAMLQLGLTDLGRWCWCVGVLVLGLVVVRWW